MRIFDIYYRDHQPKYRAVKKGLTWLGFFFTSTWLFARRMYLYGVLISLSFIPIVLLEGYTSPNTETMYSIGLYNVASCLILGFYGNKIWRFYLNKKGYKKVDSLEAKRPSIAIKTYLEKNKQEGI